MARHFGRADVIKAYHKLYNSGLSLSLSSEDNSDVSVMLLFLYLMFDADLQNKTPWKSILFLLSNCAVLFILIHDVCTYI